MGRTLSGITSVPSSRFGNESGTSRGARLGLRAIFLLLSEEVDHQAAHLIQRCGSEAYRHVQIHRRMDHKNTETTNQAAKPTSKASHAERGASSQIAVPKARSPKLPRAAPAASRAAASLPRRAPRSPAFSLRWRSCFSMSVALAQKIAGNARNKPPVSGPNAFAIAPVATVAKPPSTKRMRYSCQRVSRSAEGCIRIFMALPEQQPFSTERYGHPSDQRRRGRRQRQKFIAFHQLADRDTV